MEFFSFSLLAQRLIAVFLLEPDNCEQIVAFVQLRAVA